MKYRDTVTRRILIYGMLLFMISGAVLFTGCTKKRQNPLSKTGFYFDTVITITVYEKILENCLALAEYYEGLLSRTKEGSDIYKINHAKGKGVTVSAETLELLEAALEYAELTEGKIDPTVGTVSELWDFYHKTDPVPPDAETLQEALSHVDYRNIEISEQEVTLLDPEAVLDLGFIAKGYIADKMKEYLQSEGVTSA